MSKKVIRFITTFVEAIIGCVIVKYGYEILLNIANIMFGEVYGRYFIALMLVFLLCLFLKRKGLKNTFKKILRVDNIMLIAIYVIVLGVAIWDRL